jgi:hypothetical protein
MGALALMIMHKIKRILELIKQKTGNSWPEDVRKMAGTCKDFPTAEEIRQPIGDDAERESLLL